MLRLDFNEVLFVSLFFPSTLAQCQPPRQIQFPDHRSMKRQCLNVIGRQELHYVIALGTLATEAESPFPVRK